MGRELPDAATDSVLIRFGKGKILAAEVYATYDSRNDSNLTVTYGWTEGGEAREARHVIPAGAGSASWVVPTGRGVATKWVRMEAE